MTARFSSVTVTRHYEQIVRQIQDGIRDGQLARGHKLPTERELGLQFGVSRSVVREAIKVLDSMGLVETRQGSGIYVRTTALPTVSRALTLVVSPEETSVGHLFEFRRLLESMAARLAALRRSDAEITDIRRHARATRDASGIPAFGLADAQFHHAVYVAAGNPYLIAMLDAVREMQGDVVALFHEAPGSLAVAASHHLRVAAAIEHGDADAAAASMDEHIGYTADMVAGILAPGATPSGEKGGARAH